MIQTRTLTCARKSTIPTYFSFLATLSFSLHWTRHPFHFELDFSEFMDGKIWPSMLASMIKGINPTGLVPLRFVEHQVCQISEPDSLPQRCRMLTPMKTASQEKLKKILINLKYRSQLSLNNQVAILSTNHIQLKTLQLNVNEIPSRVSSFLGYDIFSIFNRHVYFTIRESYVILSMDSFCSI